MKRPRKSRYLFFVSLFFFLLFLFGLSIGLLQDIRFKGKGMEAEKRAKKLLDAFLSQQKEAEESENRKGPSSEAEEEIWIINASVTKEEETKEKKEPIEEGEERRTDRIENGNDATDPPVPVIGELPILGILTIPELALTLPVIYPESFKADLMDHAPVVYSGSIAGKNLVIMAHNWEGHFRGILTLQKGQEASLTFLDGTTYVYTVTETVIYHRSQTHRLYEGDWDLTLFTCVPQSYNRISVRFTLTGIQRKDNQ